MSGNATLRLIPAYFQEAAEPTAFFSGMFSVPQGGYYNSEAVEVDIVRSGEDVAIVVQDMVTGYRFSTDDIYTNKKFIAPVYKEAIAINSFDLVRRMPGKTPFEDPEFRAILIAKTMSGMRKSERKIRRAIELQASQILQTGQVSLINEAGVALYTVDFKPKAAHFPTAGTSWSTATFAQKMDDINNLSEVIRGNGLHDVDEAVCGVKVFENLMQDAGFRSRLDNRRFEGSQIQAMQKQGNGGIFRGYLEIGNYRYELWTYAGRYEHPQTGVSTKYMADGKLVLRSSNARMDATFGAIPNIARELGVSGRLLPELPGRFSGNGIDLQPNVWLSEDGETLKAGVASRPLLIPHAIDTFGCLNTQL